MPGGNYLTMSVDDLDKELAPELLRQLVSDKRPIDYSDIPEIPDRL